MKSPRFGLIVDIGRFKTSHSFRKIFLPTPSHVDPEFVGLLGERFENNEKRQVGRDLPAVPPTLGAKAERTFLHHLEGDKVGKLSPHALFRKLTDRLDPFLSHDLSPCFAGDRQHRGDRITNALARLAVSCNSQDRRLQGSTP